MYKTIEELVTRVDERNNGGIVSELIGVSIDKCFIKSVANTNGTEYFVNVLQSFFRQSLES